MSWLTKIALKKTWLTFLIVGLLTVASVWATITLKVELIPDIELPVTTVVTIHPQASSEEVADQVTVPVEGTISGIANLKHLISTSAEGMSLVLAEFEYGTDMDAVNATIKKNIAALDLPADIRSLPEKMPQLHLEENPLLIPINLSMIPLVIFSLSGDLSPDELQNLADTQIVPKLKEIEGVTLVETEGGKKEKVLISPDPAIMIERGISMSQIMALLSGHEYNSLGEIESTPLETDSVVLGDVAEVRLGPPPNTSVSRTDGKPSLSIMVMKEAEVNTVETANAVEEEVEKIKGSLGSNVELFPVFDQSVFIEESITDLTQEAIVGGVLAFIIVFLFLMVFRASLIIAISIPLSLLMGFLVMRLWGITINILTLSAMAIAVGRVIDNSIVLVEVIYRHRQEGKGFKEAALTAAREVATPITSATLATVAIFLPLAFVGGIVGEIFVPFALTITFALIASLLMSLTIVPALTRFLTVKAVKETKIKKGALDSWYLRIYTPTLKWALAHRALTLIIAVVLFVGSFGLMPIIGTSFMPEMSEKMMTVQIEMPPGTDLATISEKVAQIEEFLDRNPDVEHYQASVGTSSSVMGAFGAMMGAGDNTGKIMVTFDPGADLDKEVESLRRSSEGIAGEGKITVMTGTGMAEMMGSGVMEISVRGENFDDINAVAEDLFGELGSIKGITNLESALVEANPKLDIKPNVPKAMTSGLPMEQLQQLQGEFLLMMRGGDVPQSSVRVEGEAYPVYLDEIGRSVDTVEEAQAFRIGWPQSVAMDTIADVSLIQRPAQIQRIDGKLAARITGTITEKDIGAVNQSVQEKIDALILPAGAEVKMGGVAEEMDEVFSTMLIAIIAAIVISYIIMAAFMRSFLNPLIIMVSLPLASIGAVLALLIAGRPVGASALMGILMLVGIVLTNAIVLVTLVEQLRKDGTNTRDALLEAGRTRLRPILMTALTTMIALVPLALGVGAGVLMASELAIVVIGGLFSSTLLTLLVIPVIYSLVEGVRGRRQRGET